MTAIRSSDLATESPVASRACAVTPRITVVIPALNKCAMLRETLDSILAANSGGRVAEIVVVDNGSTDGTRELAESYAPAVRTLSGTGTIAAIRNLGARMVGGEIICFLDCDIAVPLDYFEAMEAVFQDPTIAASGFRVGLPAEPRFIERHWHRLHETQRSHIPSYINSGNFSVRREAFEAIGGFDGRLTTGEDTDICVRLRRAGHRIVADPRLEAAHLDNPKTAYQFIRKQIWHGRGMGQGHPLRTPCKVTLTTAAYIALNLFVAVAVVAGWPLHWSSVLVAAVLHLIVPASAVAFRFRQHLRVANPLPGLLIYDLYYMGRAIALLQLVLNAEPWRQFVQRASHRTAAIR
jgi:glycosyltransferase involved in cell wall biosynthesis